MNLNAFLNKMRVSSPNQLRIATVLGNGGCPPFACKSDIVEVVEPNDALLIEAIRKGAHCASWVRTYYESLGWL